MSKYIYEKINEDTFFRTFKNEYHYFCFCHGLYLTYILRNKNTKKNYSFFDYFETKKELYNHNWHFVNKSHNNLKSNLKVTKKELRKLGFTGIGATPMCPKKAIIIQKRIFNILQKNEELAKVYFDFLKTRWQKDVDDKVLLPFNSSNKEVATNNTFNNYIGFQRKVLINDAKINGKDLYNRLKKEEYYTTINERII